MLRTSVSWLCVFRRSHVNLALLSQNFHTVQPSSVHGENGNYEREDTGKTRALRYAHSESRAVETNDDSTRQENDVQSSESLRQFYVMQCRTRRGGPLDEEVFGKIGTRRLRKMGYTPGLVQNVSDLSPFPANCVKRNTNNSSIDDAAIGIVMRTKDVQRLLAHFGGRRRVCSAVIELHVQVEHEDPSASPSLEASYDTEASSSQNIISDNDKSSTSILHALPRVVHIDSVSQDIENIMFVACHDEEGDRVGVSSSNNGRKYYRDVNVPVNVIGTESSPGIKRGGFINLIQ